LPQKEKFIQYLKNEIRFCKENLNGKYIHFIHFSPLAGFYFLEKEFIPYYKEIESLGGNIGIHLHMDIPLKKYNLFQNNIDFIKEVIGKIKDIGLKPIAHRGGYFSYDNIMTKTLEENGVFLEMSNVFGRKMIYKGELVSDWSESINRVYKLDYNNFLKEGDSKVWEIPVGNSNKKYLYLEKMGVNGAKYLLWNMKKNIKSIENDQIATVITHSYMFPPMKYNTFFKPFDFCASRNRYIKYFYILMQKIINHYPIFGEILSIKFFSWQSLYNRRKFVSIIEIIKSEYEFINGDQCLEILQKSK